MECSTATYELSKGVIRSILETKDIFKTEYSVKTEEGVDQTEAHIESRYKLFQRKKGGKPGCYSKLTINMYNTTSRILVNGARLDLFMNNIFTDLKTPTSESKTKAKKFWSFVNSLKKDAFGINSLRENGILKTDTLDKANICNRQFESAFTREPDTEIPSKGTSPFTPMGEITVDPKGVLKLLNNLNIHKASGPDGLSTRC